LIFVKPPFFLRQDLPGNGRPRAPFSPEIFCRLFRADEFFFASFGWRLICIKAQPPG
jgi:hypothetical protein